MPLSFTELKTVSRSLANTAKGLATLPTNTNNPYVYYLKAANGGTVAQHLRIQQDHHDDLVRDRSVIPASDQPRGDVGTPSDTLIIGGDPRRDKLLTLTAGGTITGVANPDSTLQGGSIHVTIGFASP